jgi:hypothetical protein
MKFLNTPSTKFSSKLATLFFAYAFLLCICEKWLQTGVEYNFTLNLERLGIFSSGLDLVI